MEAFPIHCVTCRARLLVHNPSLIGQIIACPRCGSMVQVVAPPTGRSAAAVAPLADAARRASESQEHADLADLSRSPSTPSQAPLAVHAPAGMLPLSSTPKAVALPPSPIASSALDQASPTSEPHPRELAANPPTHQATLETQTLETQTVETPTTLPQPLASATGESGFWSLAWGAVGALGGASLVGALLLLLGGGDAPEGPPTKQRDAAATASANSTTTPSAAAITPHAAPPMDASAAKSAPISTPAPSSPRGAESTDISSAEASTVGADQTNSSDALKIVDAASSPPNVAPAVPSPTDVDVARGDDSSPLASPTATPSALSTTADDGQPAARPTGDVRVASGAASDAADDRVLEIDPLDLDPEGLDMSGLLARRALPGNAPVPPADTAANSSESASADDRTAPPLPEPPEELNGDPQDDELFGGPQLAKQPVVVDPTGAPPGVPPDVDRQLAQPLAKITIKDMPLAQFLTLITRLSGVPTSAAPEELRLAGIDWTRKISAEQAETTVGELLESALGPIKLGVDATTSQAIVRRQKLSAQREIVYPVSDLLRGPLTETTLAAWVRQLVAPEAWTTGNEIRADGNQGSLRVVQSERIQYELLFFLERWRTARGLPIKSRFPVDRLPDEAPELAVMAKLSAPTTFTISDYTPLQEVVAFWQQELGMTVLVDWPALQGAGLWPQTKIACRAKEQPWSVALNEILNPLGLSWRALDERTLQISSATQLNSRPELAFYRLPPAKQGDQASWQAQLDAWAVQAGAAETPGTAVLLDAPSGLLLVRHVPAVQRLVAAALPNP